MYDRKYDLICLDRDGVINVDLKKSVLCLNDFKYIPGSLSAIVAMYKAGFRVVIVTNQACVGRGDLSLENLEKIHQKIRNDLALLGAHLEKIYVCTDVEVEPNMRRKPAPGMILEALQDSQSVKDRTLMVGDDVRDYQAAMAAGVNFALVETGKGGQTRGKLHDQGQEPNMIFKDLNDFVKSELGIDIPESESLL